MPLHVNKKQAIQQWWNCLDLTKSSLQDLTELTDGKHFWDAINSVFTEEPADLIDEESLNDSRPKNDSASSSIEEDISRINETSTDEKAEPCSSEASEDPDGNQVHTLTQVKPMIVEEDGIDVNDKVDGVRGVEDETVGDIHVVKPMDCSENADSHLISIRYKTLQSFINEKYKICSKDVVNYAACMMANELELAKVAVLILTLAVKKFILLSDREKLNTLSLLDINTQQDIQECLSILFEEGKITKKVLNKILTKPTKYKVSPRKSPRIGQVCVTPPQLRSHRSSLHITPKDVLASTPSAEDVYSDSPLKKFLDSPQIRNQMLVSKNKELLQTRKILHAEEIYAEDLQLELNSMKKKLEAKVRECQSLKKKKLNLIKENQALLSRKTEIIISLEANNAEMERKLDLANKKIKELEKESKGKSESENKYLDQIITLENRLKVLSEQKKTHESLVCQIGNLTSSLTQKEFEYSDLKGEIEKVQKELQQETESHACTKSLLKEKVAEVEALLQTSALPVDEGEVLGTVIEADNKILQSKINEALFIVQKLMKDCGHEDEVIEGVKMKLIQVSRNDSDASLITFLDTTDLSEKEKEIYLKYPELERRNPLKEPSYSDCIKMDTNKTESGSPSLKRKSKVSEGTDEKPVIGGNGFGALWAQYNDGGSDSDPSSSNSDSSVMNVDLLRKLGFSEDEYSIKVDDGKKIIHTLKDYFSSKGNNGHGNLHKEWERILKCGEETLMCLSYCKESILKYLNNSAGNFLLSQGPTLCNCESISETVKHLKKENDDLKAKEGSLVSQLEEKDTLISQNNAAMKEKLALIEERDNIIQEKNTLINQREAAMMELRKKLQVAEQGLHKFREDSQQKIKELVKMLEDMKIQLAKRTSDFNEMKKSYTKLWNVDQLCKKKLAQTREKLNLFELKEKEFQVSVEKEKGIRDGLLHQLQDAKFRINELCVEKLRLGKCNADLNRKYDEVKESNQNLSNSNKDLSSEVKRLNDCVFDLKEKIEELSRGIQQNGVRNNYNINVEINQSTSRTVAPDVNHPGSNQSRCTDIPEDAANESLVSNSIINRSLHSSLMLHSEDEAIYMSHNSLEEIQSSKSAVERVRELKRRNTLYLPHMQSTYPVETQTLSDSTADALRIEQEEKKKKKAIRASTSHVPTSDTSTRLLKKRKFEEGRYVKEAGPNQFSEAGPSRIGVAGPSRIGEAGPSRIGEAGPSRPPVTPKGQKKIFKTPSSLKKLMNIRGRRLATKRP